MTSGISARIAAVLRLDPAAPAVQHGGRWTRWGDIERLRAGLDDALAAHGLGPGTRVAVVLRTRPAHVAAVLAVLATERTLVTASGIQPDATLAEDLGRIAAPVVLADAEDWARPGFSTAVAAAGSAGFRIDGDGRVEQVVAGGSASTAPTPAVAVEMLTSGTTGPPKRVSLLYANLDAAVLATGHYNRGGDHGPRLRSAVALVTLPLVHISGLWGVVHGAWEGRRLSLLERFAVEPWMALVEEHRPAVVGLPPTAMRMVLDAGVPRSVFSSVRAVLSGTAPLPTEVVDEFEASYGIPILPVYGATEFTGAVAGWTVDLHRRFRASKRGSVGRAFPGVDLRVVSEHGDDLPAGAAGILEVRAPQVRTNGADWVRTTDRARLDDDGFLWILGRADDTILRGGFKIDPGDVRDILERHPAVREAAVIGLDDRRLGQVPVAAVELVAGSDVPTEEELRAHVRAAVEPYKVPSKIRVVERLPRSPSMKVSHVGVRALFDGEEQPEAAAG